MKISNRVKRNISFTLLLVGTVCSVAWGWVVAMDPSSVRAWFELGGMIFLTSFSFSSYLEFRNLLKQGVMWGYNDGEMK
ncbi:MAG: hypothetical protein HDS27_07395 [Bacteroides sp.]|nr:hypothetical protein [Bacteroides sp.]